MEFASHQKAARKRVGALHRLSFGDGGQVFDLRVRPSAANACIWRVDRAPMDGGTRALDNTRAASRVILVAALLALAQRERWASEDKLERGSHL